MKSNIVCVFACLALVSALGCSAQVTEERMGTAGAAGGTTTSTPTPTYPITTGTVAPSHTPGKVLVTNENSGLLVPDPALVGTDNVIVLQFAIDAIGNDANAEHHEFILAPTDGGSVESIGGYPYFDAWKLIDLNTGALLLDGGVMNVMLTGELRVRFEGTIAVAEGQKIYVGLETNVFKPSQAADQQQLLDHEYRVSKTPYSQGDILDQNALVVPSAEITEDAPMLGDPMIVVAN